MGVNDSVPLQGTMADSNIAKLSSQAGACENRSYLYLAVVLFASAVYLGCIVSPPSLMDDVDGVQAQIARNMLTSGDWVTARLDGVPYLEKAPLVYWAIAGSYSVFGVHDWSARIPIALSAIGLAWLVAAFAELGLRKTGQSLRGFMYRHLHRPFSFHANSHPRRHAHFHHRLGDVGILTHSRRRRTASATCGP